MPATYLWIVITLPILCILLTVITVRRHPKRKQALIRYSPYINTVCGGMFIFVALLNFNIEPAMAAITLGSGLLVLITGLISIAQGRSRAT